MYPTSTLSLLTSWRVRARGAPLSLDPGPRLAERILERLPIGVLVIAHGHLRYANYPARRALELVGERLPEALARELPEPGLVVVTPSGRRVAVRVRGLDAGEHLLTVAPPQQDAELIEVLRARFELSARECEVALAVREGLSNKEIAARFGLTLSTVKTYLTRVFAALDVGSRTRLLLTLDAL